MATDSLIHTTDGIVDDITSVAKTLTMPVPTPDYPNPDFLPSHVSNVLYGQPLPAPPAPPMPPAPPANESAGIDSNTLTEGGATSMPHPVGDIKGKEFTVKTKTNVEIKLFEPLPLVNQPAALQAKVNQGGLDIGFNCHGFSFGAYKVQGQNGIERSMWINDAAQVNKLISGPNAIYVKIELKNGQVGDIVVLKSGTDPIHSMKLKTAPQINYKGQVILDPAAKVETKNGALPLKGDGGVVNAPTLISTNEFYLAVGKLSGTPVTTIEAYRLK